MIERLTGFVVMAFVALALAAYVLDLRQRTRAK